MSTLAVGGLTPITTLDYPGQLSGVVFCQGCPWRCGYCHNTHLLPRRGPQRITWQDTKAFLQRRQGLLDAVVFSGGEPLMQRGLVDAMRDVRSLGFKIGLHTAGVLPDRLRAVLPYLDWVAMDIKAPFSDYGQVTRVPKSGVAARLSAQSILDSGVEHEFRTTLAPGLLNRSQIFETAVQIADMGAKHYAWQAYRALAHSLPHSSNQGLATGYCPTSDLALRTRVSGLFAHFTYRGAVA
jgi:pyruvate formate lyase activating enzyme